MALTAARALALYRLLFSGLIIAASVATLATDHDAHAYPLAASEILGALLLLWRRSEIAGAGMLLIMFATAQLILFLNGQWAAHLLQYAASVIFIVLLGRSRSIRHEHDESATIEHEQP